MTFSLCPACFSPEIFFVGYSFVPPHFCRHSEGVGPVRVGQKIKAGITDLLDVEFDVQKRNRSFSADAISNA